MKFRNTQTLLGSFHFSLRISVVNTELRISNISNFRNSNLTGAGFGEKLFSDHRTICLMKLMASTMSAAIKRQYSKVLPLLRHCLPVFNENCGMAMDYIFSFR